MCNVCCREFRGWCKSFTRAETLLCVLEGVLLVVFIGFLIFLLLHLLACSKQDISYITNTTSTVEQNFSQETSSYIPYPIETPFNDITNESDMTTEYEKTIEHTSIINNLTLPPDVQCSWTPSIQTEATTHYYEFNTHVPYLSTHNETLSQEIKNIGDVSTITDIWFGVDESDGEEADPQFKKLVMALVKLRPLKDIVFGCTLTIISKYWTLTAASCIESIEEVDSLDSFVIMENYGGPDYGITYALADIQIHPFYQGTNRSYDLAALKSYDSLVGRNGASVALPQQIYYTLITPGERFTILGYGNFRSPHIEIYLTYCGVKISLFSGSGPPVTTVGVTRRKRQAFKRTINQMGSERRLRGVHVFSVGGGACGAWGGAGWAARHLWRGRGAGRGACGGAGAGAGGARPLCAGVLYARGVSCNYCAGTPLVRGRELLAVMAGGDQCGVTCEPALYADVAAARPWLDRLLHSDQ